MKNRRTQRDDLEKRRPTFLLIGLVIALSITYGLLNLESERPDLPVCKSSVAYEPDDLVIPNTWREPEKVETVEEIKEQKQDLLKNIIEAPNDFKKPMEERPIDEPLATIPEIIVEEDPVIEVDIYALERMPIFPGCENLLNEEERFNCFVDKVAKHVVGNFKPCEGAFGTTKEKLYIQFTIDEFGVIQAAKAIRGNDACNIDRALFAVTDLPKMKPGEYRGKPVRTRFVLPINIK